MFHIPAVDIIPVICLHCVCGDSMIKAGIYDKDIVIVRKTPHRR